MFKPWDNQQNLVSGQHLSDGACSMMSLHVAHALQPLEQQVLEPQTELH